MKNLEEWRKLKQVEVYGEVVVFTPKLVDDTKLKMVSKTYPYQGRLNLVEDSWVELEATFKKPTGTGNETRHYRLYVGDVLDRSMKGVTVDLKRGHIMVFTINRKG